MFIRRIHSALMIRPVIAVPRLARILELDRIGIFSRRRDVNRIGQITIHRERLRRRIDGRLGHESDLVLVGVVDQDVEGVVGSDAVLVALPLHDVHGAPPGRVGRLRHRLVVADAEERGADVWDTASPEQFLVCAQLAAGAEFPGVVALLGDQGVEVERFPVVDVGELEDGAVEAVGGVTVDTAGFGVGDGEVAD